MLNKNISLLKVDYDLQKGLLLKWNLTGMLNNQFYRHIIVLDSDDRLECQNFITVYFSKIKAGDLVCIGYFNEQQELELTAWKQKNKMEKKNLKLCNFYGSIPRTDRLNFIVNKIQQQMKDYDQLAILSILTAKNQQEVTSFSQSYQSRVKTQSFNMVVSFFGDLQNDVWMSSKINTFNVKGSDSIQTVLKFYKMYLNQIALLDLKLTIQCRNGNICCQQGTEWKNQDWNRISRQIHFVSSLYELDTIYFLNQEFLKNIKYELEIKLEFRNCQKKKFTASKAICIETMSQKVYNRTIGQKFNKETHHLYKQWLETSVNPFKCQSLVWFKKQNNSTYAGDIQCDSNFN